MNKIYIIGIGYKPLDKRARDIIYNSEVILASNRLFDVFKAYEEFEKVKEKIKVISNVDEIIEFIKSQISSRLTPHASRSVVLLASGDPLFFGIGGRVIREFGKDIVEILPDLSSIQVAFSRIKETWDDAFLMSLHGCPDPEKKRRLSYEITDIPLLFQRYNKIAILTDRENNPVEIAKTLLKSEISNLKFACYVCERLDYPDEKITEGTPEEIAEMSFSDPNVVILVQKSGGVEELKYGAEETPAISNFRVSEPRFGLEDDEILHSKGLITKDEVRAVTIHKLRLLQKGIFWDIGAGSGSVSIEAARLFPELKIIAIEKDENQIENLRKNRIRFGTKNIETVKGEAPEVLKDLSSPDRVFIGGSGGRFKEILELVNKGMPSGIIVINATSIDTLNEAIRYLEDNKFNVDVSEVSISRSKIIANKRHMNALNPIFIIRGEK